MGPLKSDADLLRLDHVVRRQHQRPPSPVVNFFSNFNPTRCGAILLLFVLGILSLEFLLMHVHVVQEPRYMDTREESPPGSRLDRILPLRDQAPELVNARTSDASAEEGGEKWLKATAVDYIKEDTRTEDEQQPGVFNIQPHHLHMQPSDDGEDSGESSLSGGGDVNKDSGDGGNDGFETVERESRQQAGRMEEDDSDDYGDMRIAVLVPYSGPGLPVWFDAFMDLAAANGKLMDWIIFCDQEFAQVKTPYNVKMIPTSPRELAWLLAGVVYPADADDSPEIFVEDLNEAMTMDLTAAQDRYVNARLLATRFIQKLLSKNPYYMVEFKPALGWIFRNYLDEYSHWAYGDLDVFFGDLTKGWLEPREMREYDIVTYSFGDQHRAYLRGQLTVHKSIPKVNDIWRHCNHLSDYMHRIDRTRVTKRYTLESAEGCYSAALMFSRDVKAKYAVRVFTDMPGGGFEGPGVDVVITGDALVKKCPSVRNRIGEVGGKLAALPQMQVDEGNFVQVYPAPEGTQCEYWVNDRFQTCIELVLERESSNVYLLNGQFFQRGFKNLWEDVVEDGCTMGAFLHFQDYKVHYRPWNTRPPMPPIHMGMVARESGLVPLPNGDWTANAMNPNAPQPWNRDRFTHRYCMEWNVDMEKEKNAFSCIVSVTAKDALRTLYDTRTEEAKILGGEKAATLGGVGGIEDLDGLLHSMREWTGPKILVLILSVLDADEVMTRLVEEEGLEDSCGMENTLVMAFLVPKTNEEVGNTQKPLRQEMPYKSLFNALNDLCQTRHLLMLAPGFRLGRGTEKVVANALAAPLEKPRVLVIPQWCIDPEPKSKAMPSLDIEDARRRAGEGTAGLCHERAKINEKGYQNVWLGAALAHEPDKNEAEVRNGRSLLRSDMINPVIVVDMWSAPALFLRHVEEFTRSQCFDGAYARGLWTAGFSFAVLPEALSFYVASQLPSNGMGCRAGAETPAVAYSLFLKSIRQVYSNARTTSTNNVDQFRLMNKGYDRYPATPFKGKVKHSRKSMKKRFRTRGSVEQAPDTSGDGRMKFDRQRDTGSADIIIKHRRGSEPIGRLPQQPSDGANADVE